VCRVPHRDLNPGRDLVGKIVDGRGRHAADDGPWRAAGDGERVRIRGQSGVGASEDAAGELDDHAFITPSIQVPTMHPQPQCHAGREGGREVVGRILHGQKYDTYDLGLSRFCPPRIGAEGQRHSSTVTPNERAARRTTGPTPTSSKQQPSGPRPNKPPGGPQWGIRGDRRRQRRHDAFPARRAWVTAVPHSAPRGGQADRSPRSTLATSRIVATTAKPWTGDRVATSSGGHAHDQMKPSVAQPVSPISDVMSGDGLFALVGASRCHQYSTLPVSVPTATDSDGPASEPFGRDSHLSEPSALVPTTLTSGDAVTVGVAEIGLHAWMIQIAGTVGPWNRPTYLNQTGADLAFCDPVWFMFGGTGHPAP
jgi:hypothetical protein